jgi:hypothetical protein
MTLEFGIAYQEFLADWCRRAERRLADSVVSEGKGR